MWFAAFLCVLVGASIVAQNSVNAQLSKHNSLWLLLTVGNIVAAIGSFVVYCWTTKARFSLANDLSRMPLAVLVPAIAGFVITSAMPMAITRIGVFRSVMLVIACQIVASLVWDRWALDQSVTPLRLLGAGLVLGGAALVMRG
jgi:uncharacterized membrane protein YdcZ (DUF606 family)